MSEVGVVVDGHGFQCDECGELVKTVIRANLAGAWVRFEPCGHVVKVETA